jgi:hypothetical protein
VAAITGVHRLTVPAHIDRGLAVPSSTVGNFLASVSTSAPYGGIFQREANAG